MPSLGWNDGNGNPDGGGNGNVDDGGNDTDEKSGTGGSAVDASGFQFNDSEEKRALGLRDHGFKEGQHPFVNDNE